MTASSDRNSEQTSQDWALCALLFGAAAATGLTPVADGDVYWHLAAGREIARTGAWLSSDAFSVSAAGRPWLDVHWLFQLALFGLHSLGGLSALVFAKCLMVGSGSVLLYFALDRRARSVFVPIVVAALFCARHLLLVRPVIVSLLFMAFCFFRLERFRRDGNATRLLIQLPLAQIVWSNCQGLFALGPALIGAYLIAAYVFVGFGARTGFPFAAESSRPGYALTLLRTFTLSFAATLCTPYGVRALELPLKLLLRLAPSAANPFENVAENLPPYLLERFSPEQVWHLKWFLGLLALCLLFAAGRLLLSHVLILVGLVALALISNRNVLLLYWLGMPIAALAVAPRLTRLLQAQLFTRLLPHALVLALLLVVGTAAARETSFSEPAPFHIPVASVHIIEQLSGHGTIFSADHQGGYLIWKLFPRYRPYIDTRLVLRTAEQYREYLELADHPERFEAFERRHGFSYVILPVVYPDRYLDLIAQLYESPAWTLIYTDGSDVVFARRSTAAPETRVDLDDAATTDRLSGELAQRFQASPRLLESARLQLATLDIAVHAFTQAERILSQTSSPAARALSARARLLADDLGGAEQIAETLMRDDDHDVRTLDLMATLAVRRGQLPNALTYVRRALAIDPFDSEATRLLGKMEASHGP